MTKALEGGCFCGLVRYRFPDKPYPAGNCHCRMCQRLSGSAYVSWVVIPVTEFEYLEEKAKDPAVFLQSYTPFLSRVRHPDRLYSEEET